MHTWRQAHGLALHARKRHLEGPSGRAALPGRARADAVHSVAVHRHALRQGLPCASLEQLSWRERFMLESFNGIQMLAPVSCCGGLGGTSSCPCIMLLQPRGTAQS